VYPPSGSTGIALAPPPPDGEAKVGKKETGIVLSTDDIDAAHAELKDAGADVDAEVARMGGPVPPMFWFRDPEGNSLLVVEQQG
jgi:predicted enzyme related to lactoylglutathione lyase